MTGGTALLPADDDDLPAAIALAALPGMGPARLTGLLARWPPAEALQHVRRGVVAADPGDAVVAAMSHGPGVTQLAERWRRAALGVDEHELWRRHRRAGVGVTVASRPDLPRPLATDADCPPVLFWLGDLAATDAPAVTVVGTRDCSRHGFDVARRLGDELSLAAVAVVSGLALGIDGAAHAGALNGHASGGAPPVAVVGSGLDVVYPRRNADLWHAVAARGVVLSEYPLGTPAEAWHFPARNRLLASLGRVVVVVESREEGGAMLTAELAEARDRPLLAVPGCVDNPVAAGPHLLLRSGAASLLTTTDDTLMRLGLPSGTPAVDRSPQPSPPGGLDGEVLRAVGWTPVGFDQLVLRCSVPVGELSLALDRLEAAGWVRSAGGRVERCQPGRSGPA